ncbi:MAG: undecaprenyl-diphosphate phosphatase, partial [Muribaculaceae bacterium]
AGKGYKARDINFLDAFVIGIAQSIAVLPGLSRSGTTIATGLLIGNKREQVAQFSFLMVIIPILGEALLDIKDYISEPATTAAAAIGWLPMIVGFLASFIVGCLACKWMLNIVKKGKLIWFAVYCLIVGVLCIAF